MAGPKAETIALVCLLLLADLLFSGIIFGWSPLLLLLQKEGQYAERCAEGESSCLAQGNAFNLIFTLGAFTVNMVALPEGLFLDRVGPQVAIGWAGVLLFLGLLGMAMSDSSAWDLFVPSYCLLALGGQMTMMTCFSSSFLIPSIQNGVLAATSCLFDASSAIFLIFLVINQTFDIPRRDIFFGYALLCLALYGVLFVLWGRNLKYLDLTTVDGDLLEESDLEDTPLIVGRGARRGDKEPEERPVPLTERSAIDQLKSMQFRFILFYMCVEILRANVYIGTQNQFLENLGDGQKGHFYTHAFGIILPLGFLFIPVIERTLAIVGLVPSLHITNGLGVVYNALQLIPSLLLQLFSFFIFTGFRAYLYACISAFFAKTFGLANIGTLIGVGFTLGSIVNLLQGPLVYYSNSLAEGNLLYINLLCVALAMLVAGTIEWYRRGEIKERVPPRRLLSRSPSIHLRSPLIMRSPASRPS